MRVLAGGGLGFAATTLLVKRDIKTVVDDAVRLAKASRRKSPISFAQEGSITTSWSVPEVEAAVIPKIGIADEPSRTGWPAFTRGVVAPGVTTAAAGVARNKKLPTRIAATRERAAIPRRIRSVRTRNLGCSFATIGSHRPFGADTPAATAGRGPRASEAGRAYRGPPRSTSACFGRR